MKEGYERVPGTESWSKEYEKMEMKGGDSMEFNPGMTREEARRQRLRMLVLVSVCLQTTTYMLIRRWSQGVLKEKYSPSANLLVAELLKLGFSGTMTALDPNPSDATSSSLLGKYWWLVVNSQVMLVPAAIYLSMNLLSFVALERIDAGTFAVCAQLKILTTGLFSVTVLGRSLSTTKWRSLGFLLLGATLMSYQTLPHKDQCRPATAANSTLSLSGGIQSDDSADLESPASFLPGEEVTGLGLTSDQVQYLVGLGAVLVEVTLSGFVTVYFEKVLKSNQYKLSVWDRNVQLAVYSILIYGGMAVYHDPTDPFAGWSAVAWLVAFLGAMGGILVALTLKHTDAILKTIATSGSIVLTTVIGSIFLNGPMDIPIIVGAGVTVLAIFNYNSG